ncbi:AAA family ATPase [Amycolatopsis panacis]|uniref:Helix-turn-helix transcriptional regulator n=1 Tax=Amycolatopsis panacis TaxID=2340917 RepID=A0A419HJY3_9PSEU|nr:LuxR family transcriptional regulator [Amycolatopsis panacis]RJQ76183.1 helix-turn-helix transcriptional regulator [Amycolatopsis panacis]
MREAGIDLVGRESELSWLVARMCGQAAGAGPVVVLSGPCGIGKTSLVRAAAARAAAAGLIVCSVAAALESREDEFGVAVGLRTGLRAAGAPVSEPFPDTGCGAEFGAWVRAAPGLVLVIDNVQWCDEQSLRWLATLLRATAGLRLRVVLVWSGETISGVTEHIAELTSLHGTEVLDVGPLSEVAVAELVGAAVGADAGELFANRCFAESGGNPLLLNGMLGELGGTGTGLLPFACPAGGADLVRSLFTGLPAHVRRVACAIAVLGRNEPALLARLAEIPVRTALAAVDVLRQQHILAAEGPGFRHDPVRGELLRQLPAAGLERLRRSAALLLSDAAGAPEEIARQILELSSLDEWMVDILREAARSAEDRNAPWEAVRYLRPAVNALPGDVRLAVQFAETVARLDPVSGFALMAQALRGETDPRECAGIALRLGRLALVARRCGEAVDAMEAALARLTGDAADEQLGGELRTALCLVGIEDRHIVAGRLNPRLRALRDGNPDQDPEAGQLALRAVVAALRGTDRDQAVSCASRAVRACDIAVDDSPVPSAVLALLLADEVGLARDELSRAIELVPAQRSEYLALRALLGHWCGDLIEAAADARAAYVHCRRAEGRAGGVVPRVALATVLVRRGDLTRAARLLREADGPELREHSTIRPQYLLAQAHILGGKGRTEEALRTFRQCRDSLAEIDIGNELLAPWWFDAAWLLAELGRSGEVAEFVAHSTETVLGWGTPRAIGMVRLVRALTVTGRERIALLEEAAATLAGSPAGLEEAMAECRLGMALFAHGDVRGARDRLRRAVALSARNGDRWLLHRAHRAAAEAGLADAMLSPLAVLSSTERQVAVLAGSGASNRVIAEQLFITVRTVETHLTSVYRKLRIPGRAGLAGVLHPGRREAGELVRADR